MVNPIERAAEIFTEEYYHGLATLDRDKMDDMTALLNLLAKHWPEKADAGKARQIGF